MIYKRRDISSELNNNIMQLYINGVSLDDIEKLTGVSKNTLLYVLNPRKFNIKREEIPTFKTEGEKILVIADTHIGSRWENLKYIDEAYDINEEVFQLLKSRLSFEYSICDFAGNPQHLSHWLEKFINSDIDIYLQRYTIFDNPFLPPEYVKQLCKEYEGTVFYDRYILGKPCNAEGIIYRQFANNPSLFICDEAKDKYGNNINFMIISIGIDYGATKGETEFKATGITTMFKEVWTIGEKKLTGLHTPEEMYEAFVNFYYEIVNEYGKVTHAFGDYGALGQVITYGLNKFLRQKNIPLQVQDCIKGQIIDRIHLDCQLFGQMRRFILKKCKYLKEAYEQAVWSDKEPDTRLDDGTTPIDDLDASEYSMFPFYDKLMTNIR